MAGLALADNNNAAAGAVAAIVPAFFKNLRRSSWVISSLSISICPLSRNFTNSPQITYSENGTQNVPRLGDASGSIDHAAVSGEPYSFGNSVHLKLKVVVISYGVNGPHLSAQPDAEPATALSPHMRLSVFQATKAPYLVGRCCAGHTECIEWADDAMHDGHYSQY